MRYLFGDSTPFPHPFDFLKTLEAFMTAGTRVVLLEHRAWKLNDEAFIAQRERAQGLEALGRFHEAALVLIGAPGPSHALVAEYAQRLTERAVQLVEQQRRAVAEADDRDGARTRSERERANEECGKHLAAFFQAARMPALATTVETTLTEGKPSARATVVHPGGVTVTFTLGTAKSPAWETPRKLAELTGRLELVVGIKKSWIGNKISREPVRLDDWVIGSAGLSEAAATIAVRKKPDQKDTLVFKLRRDQGVFSAKVEHPGDPNAALVPLEAEASDLPHLERLWTALRATFDEVLEERAAITSITLDGDEVLGSALAQRLIERLVTVLAPTALEVARRSPNARELSLKREGDGGRREEVYLKRDQLIGALEPLPHDGRAIFAPLGLDDWVPSATTRPPPVVEPTRPMLDLEINREELSSLDFDET